jgi:uncharacterized membrane protein YphA (DoxX/SURF4 family)
VVERSMSGYLELGCRGLLAGVFLISLAGKLRGRAAYAAFVAATASLLATGGRQARVLAPLTIVAELGTVVALAIGPFGLVAGAALLGCFTVALVLALRRGSAAPCRCFGASTTPIGLHHVVRNVVLAGLAVAGAIAGSVADDQPIDPAALAVTALAVAIAVLVTVRLDDLVDLLA